MKNNTSQPLRNEVYRIKITLVGSKPPIWRRFQVPSDITLSHLHRVLQVVMGWHDCHLHQFVVPNGFGGVVRYGVPNQEFDYNVKSERSVKLSSIVAGPKSKFGYQYDFGDGWEHNLLVEGVLPATPDTLAPLCLVGKRACPPEDCGGIWGYHQLVETLADPSHEDHQETREWVSDDFDPERFDLEEVNLALKRLR